jgi:hypothetical protein
MSWKGFVVDEVMQSVPLGEIFDGTVLMLPDAAFEVAR